MNLFTRSRSPLILLLLALAFSASMPSVFAQEETKPDAPPAVEAPAATVGSDAAPDAVPAPAAPVTVAEPDPAPAPAPPTVKVNLEGVDLKAVAAEFAGSQQDSSGLNERIANTQSLLNELLASRKAMEDGGSGARSILEAAFLASKEPVQVYVLNPQRLLVIFQGKEKVEAVLVTVRE